MKKIICALLMFAGSNVLAAPTVVTTCNLGNGNSLSTNKMGMTGAPVGNPVTLKYNGDIFKGDAKTLQAADGRTASIQYGMATQKQSVPGGQTFRQSLTLTIDGNDIDVTADCTDLQGETLF